jgi:hypothetical protein
MEAAGSLIGRDVKAAALNTASPSAESFSQGRKRHWHMKHFKKKRD